MRFCHVLIQLKKRDSFAAYDLASSLDRMSAAESVHYNEKAATVECNIPIRDLPKVYNMAASNSAKSVVVTPTVPVLG